MRLSNLYFSGLLMLCSISSFAQSTEAQSIQTMTGTVSDSMCGAQHMMKDASPAKCTRECVKAGSDYALVSGGKVYTLKGKSAQFDKFSGQAVKVTGKLSGSTFTVDSIPPVEVDRLGTLKQMVRLISPRPATLGGNQSREVVVDGVESRNVLIDSNNDVPHPGHETPKTNPVFWFMM